MLWVPTGGAAAHREQDQRPSPQRIEKEQTARRRGAERTHRRSPTRNCTIRLPPSMRAGYRAPAIEKENSKQIKDGMDDDGEHEGSDAPRPGAVGDAPSSRPRKLTTSGRRTSALAAM